MKDRSKYIKTLLRNAFDEADGELCAEPLFYPIATAKDLGFEELAYEMESDLTLGERAVFNQLYSENRI